MSPRASLPAGKGVLTLPSADGSAGKVGYGHRGGSCGWTICPAPGHRAVARRGVIAMRRAGVIAALGALLACSEA
jgi:hypothetical protein